MKIEDLVQLISSRLREFRLSRDYARMNGDLERMNLADKEVLALEETLYKLNLLIDVSKSVSVQENTLTAAITNGSTAVLADYDITPYATDPLHEQKIMNILSKMEVMDSVEKIDHYIRSKYPSSPVTGEMVMNASSAYSVDSRLMMAMMEQDSSFGTAGKAVRTLNPGNVGNDDEGNTRTYESWQKGVTAVAEWLNRHRASQKPVVVSESSIPEPVTDTKSTVITSTTTTVITTPPETPSSTPSIITTPAETTSSTPSIITTPAETTSSTPSIITTPAETTSSTPSIITTPAETTSSTPELIITPSADTTNSNPTSSASVLITSTTTVTTENAVPTEGSNTTTTN